ncbi:transcriptional regulator [Streptomyces griseus]|uniref:AfsR/SARP family transcriptional regulator n=1 Tax=Streptomyces griseus TaxID=1911 RepID=UPI00089B8F5B|nr:AfsR/SARP family transcriptional regulator [Streptomyces griseus]SEE86438.1 DNA-binding transcriptional activator of the SARP family [Streptomyces griseus]SQA23473.1 transcriptional regulator [Streptomyces griseus]
MDRDNGPRVRVPEQRTPSIPATADALRFTVLGPVRAWRGSELLSSGSPQQRALLTALLLREGRTATAGELIDAFWGEDPPSQALATIRTYASRLRKILGQDTLVSESGGYAIRTERSALDLTLAQDLAAEAEKARAAGDRCQARTLINKVLGLWDGEALASVPGPYADNQRTRLEEWRLQLTETRLDLDLEVGCHAEAVSELTALTAAHPLRERLRELLMVALYRSGRQAEALAVYADTRRLLAEELGVDPRPELAQLQQRILRADEELARPADEPAPAPAPLKPAQLPATVPDFTGRSAFVTELGSRLATAEGSVMAVSAVAGIGGVGKTTLAVHVAHQARRHFPDGQLYVDLQGAGARAAEPETVLGSFLRALGTADSAIPDTLDERAALYRSTLDGRRILILLDNAHDAAQIRPLLPGTPGCAALVTSRVRMVDLAGAHLVDLDPHVAEDLLEALVDTSLVESAAPGRYRYHDLVRLYARACAERDEQPPVRRELALSRLLDFYLATAAGVYALERPGERVLDHFTPTEYPGLTFPAREAALDWLFTESSGLLACARQSAAIGMPQRAADLLMAVVDLGESGANSHQFATAAKAVSEAAKAAGVPRAEARARTMLSHVHSVSGRFAEAEAEAMRALDLGRLAQDAVSQGQAPNQRGIIALYENRHDDAEAHLTQALTAFRADGNKPGEAAALCNLSRVHLATGRTATAVRLAEEGVAIYDSDASGLALRLANGKYALGLALIGSGRTDPARHVLLEALQIFRESRQQLWHGMTLFRLSELHLTEQEGAQAAAHAEQSLVVLRGIGGDWRRANVLTVLGRALTVIGQTDRAQVCWGEALTVFEELGSPEAEAVRQLLDPAGVG